MADWTKIQTWGEARILGTGGAASEGMIVLMMKLEGST